MTKERKQQPENSRSKFVRKLSPPYWNFPAKSQRWTFSLLVSIPLGHRWAKMRWCRVMIISWFPCCSVNSAKWWSSVDYPFGMYGFQLPWSSMGRMLWWDFNFFYAISWWEMRTLSVPHNVTLNRFNFFRFCGVTCNSVKVKGWKKSFFPRAVHSTTPTHGYFVLFPVLHT